MWTFIFVALAAVFNFIMDTLIFWKARSPFKNLDDKWWNPMVSWMHVKNFLGWQRFDAWHIAKMGCIFSFILAIFSYRWEGPVFGLWDLPLLYLVWGVAFEIPKKIFIKS